MTQNNFLIIGRKNQLRTDRDRMEGSMRRGEWGIVRSFHQWKRDSADYLMENHESTASLGERKKQVEMSEKPGCWCKLPGLLK